MLPQVKAKYTGHAVAAASFAPSSKGNQQIAIPFEITQGEHAGETITWIGVFHDTQDRNGMTGSERVIESLQFMGWRGDELAELAGVDDARIRELLPDEVELACDVDTYEGKTRLKVQWINRAGSGRFAFKEALAGNDLKTFSSQMRGQIRNMQGAKKTTGNGASKPVPHPYAPGRKDDLPFLTCELSMDINPIARVLR